MIRYLLIAVLLAAALVVEALLATVPVAGWLSPDMGLLFIVVYAMRSSGDDMAEMAFLAGLLKGSLVRQPAGFFILVYLVIAAAILWCRGLLFIEHASTRAALVVLAALWQEATFLGLVAAGLLGLEGDSEIIRPLLSGVAAACLAPAAVSICDRSRALRFLLEP